MRFPNSMLARIPTTLFQPCEDDGAYFIDRDPKLFKIIMEVLRKGYIKEIGDDIEKEELIEEAKYFLLDDILDKFTASWESSSISQESSASWESSSTSHNVNGKRASQISGKCGCLLSNNGFKTGVHRWTLRIISRTSTCMIGVAPDTVNRSSYNYSTNGHYMNLNDGTLYSGPPFSCGQSSGCTSVNSGTILILDLNCNTGTLIFNVNGKEYLAYQNIPMSGKLYLAFDNDSTAGSEVEII